MSEIPYCPRTPTEKQRLFLACDTKEVFFGGAAGGGKSVALLMAALKYVKQSGYAALILRKDLPRLELPGGLIPLSHQWFSGQDGVKWNAARRTWIFETSKDMPPATITFGYLSRPLDRYRYLSSEFQYIAFDELTDFQEEDYRYMFSRLRKPTTWSEKQLRMRSASNPGGSGRLWVKQRFIDGAEPLDKSPQKFMKDGHCYIPSRLEDNTHLDAEAYRDSLSHLPPVEREQLLSGDWDIQPDGVFQQEWLRYYVETLSCGSSPGQVELLTRQGKSLATIVDQPHALDRFITIDPASTAADKVRRGGREPSWSVIQVWDQPRAERWSKFLLLRHQVRQRLGFTDLCETIKSIAELYSVKRIYIENENLGKSVIDHFQAREQLVVVSVATGSKSKETRSVTLQDKMHRGEVFFPRDNNEWLEGLESEFLSWNGDSRQPADQIDAASYAAIIAEQHSGRAVRVQSAVVLG